MPVELELIFLLTRSRKKRFWSWSSLARAGSVVVQSCELAFSANQADSPPDRDQQ